MHRARLQPIDTGGLLVAHVVLEADVDIIAAFQHLLGGLGEARLVAIDRRDREETRQDVEQRRHDQHDRGARVRGHGEVDDLRKPALGRALQAHIAGRDRHLPRSWLSSGRTIENSPCGGKDGGGLNRAERN